MANKKQKITPVQSVGFGDDVEKVLNSKMVKPITDTVKKFIWGDSEDCGCTERKEQLNKLFKYRTECLTEDEFNYLDSLFKRLSTTLTREDQAIIIPMYNRIFNTKQKPTQCSTCWRNIIESLKKIHRAYVEEQANGQI